jgi:putative ABC transport system permease protein
LGLPLEASISPLAGLAAALSVLLVVGISAAVPAMRAARLSPVQALADVGGRTPRRAGWAHALRLPLSLELGVGLAFSRPLRAALTVAAVIAGVATLVFSFGLHLTLDRLGPDITLEQSIQVQVTRFGSYSDEKVTSILQQQPQTSNVVAAYYGSVAVPGLADPVSATALRGDSSRLGYRLLAGRWFSGLGEAVAPAGLLRDANIKIGDSIAVAISGHAVNLRIVGEEFDVVNFGHIVRFDAATWKEAVPDALPDVYFVQLRPGSDAAAYVDRIQRAEPDFISAQVYSLGVLGTLDTLNRVLVALVAVLAAIASTGVFASVLLTVRERVRDTAVLRALGMPPRQVALMWAAAAAALGILGGLAGVAAGIGLHGGVLLLIGQVIGSGMPANEFQVFDLPVLPVGVLAGTVLAVLGAGFPARWAASLTPARALQAE